MAFLPVKNLLIPAFGDTKCFTVTLPGAQGYAVNISAINIDDSPFIPQSITVNSSAVPSGETVLFEIPRLGWQRICQGGRIETFTVPAITDMEFYATPSDGLSPVQVYMYNFPMMPDIGGLANAAQTVLVTGQPPITGRSSLSATGVDTGAIGSTMIAAPGAGLRLQIHNLSVSINDNDTFTIFSDGLVRGATSLANIASFGISTANNKFSLTWDFATPVILGDNEALALAASPATTQAVGNGIRYTVVYSIV